MAVFPYARLQVLLRKISKIICILNTVIHLGGIRFVLLSLKYWEVSFRRQNKIVLLSAAPPLRKTSPFFHSWSSPLLVLIVCRQFEKYAIALKLCDYTSNLIMFPPIWMVNEYHFQFQYNHLSKMKYTILFLSVFACAGDAYLAEIEWP